MCGCGWSQRHSPSSTRCTRCDGCISRRNSQKSGEWQGGESTYLRGTSLQKLSNFSQYTTQISVDPDLRFQGAEKGMVPVQVLFCLKEKNAKKLNSHRWFFNAFSPLLNPNVCVLLDVGTRPGGKSIYHLWKAFDHNSSVGGACGEIKAMKGRAWRALLNPLVAAQNFEYKVSLCRPNG